MLSDHKIYDNLLKDENACTKNFQLALTLKKWAQVVTIHFNIIMALIYNKYIKLDVSSST